MKTKITLFIFSIAILLGCSKTSQQITILPGDMRFAYLDSALGVLRADTFAFADVDTDGDGQADLFNVPMTYSVLESERICALSIQKDTICGTLLTHKNGSHYLDPKYLHRKE